MARTPDEADVAVVRIQAPFEPRNGNFIEALFHAGPLAFAGDDIAWLLELMRRGTDRRRHLSRSRRGDPRGRRRRCGASRELRRDGRRRSSRSSSDMQRPSGSLPFELPSSTERSVDSCRMSPTTRTTRSSPSATGSPTRARDLERLRSTHGHEGRRRRGAALGRGPRARDGHRRARPLLDAEIEGSNVKVIHSLTSMGCPRADDPGEHPRRGRRPAGRRAGRRRAHLRAAVDTRPHVGRREVHPGLRLGRFAGISS